MDEGGGGKDTRGRPILVTIGQSKGPFRKKTAASVLQVCILTQFVPYFFPDRFFLSEAFQTDRFIRKK
jgi:hypothetical protein